MKFNNNYYYDNNKRFLSIIGQWPYQKPKARLFFLAFALIFLSNSLITQMAYVFIHRDNMECILQTMPVYFLMFNTMVKVLTYRLKSGKIKALTDHLFADWDMFETREEREILRKYAENGRRYTLIYSLYLYATAILCAITSLMPRIMDIVFPLNTSRPVMLIWPAYYFVDEEKYYYYIYSDMLIILMVCLAALIAHDSMFFVYIQHVCGLFAAIGFRFKYLMYKHNISFAKKSLIDCPDIYHKHIVFSIHAHRKALKFAILIENVFSKSFAIQLVVNTICISISLLQLSIHLHDMAEAMRYGIYIIAQLFHLFCFSFQGQNLINHSLKTHNEIYHGVWYKMPVREQKLLLLVMRKSIEASTVTAYKIYVFSLQNFTTVLQSSVSYFMMLASFSE